MTLSYRARILLTILLFLYGCLTLLSLLLLSSAASVHHHDLEWNDVVAASLETTAHLRRGNDDETIPQLPSLFSPSAACSPRNVHLSPASNVDPTTNRIDMTVSFTLDDNSHERHAMNCSQQEVRVLYHLDDEKPRIAKPTEVLQFDYHPSSFQSFSSSYINHVALTDILAGSQRYGYRIVVGSSATTTTTTITATPIISFLSPPNRSQTNNVRVALVADWGGTDDSVATMRSMLASQTKDNQSGISAVVVAGDLSYATGHLPTWEAWLGQMEPLFRSVPLLVAAGNHEIECDAHDHSLFSAYEHYFRVPNRIYPAERLPSSETRFRSCLHPAEFTAHYEYGNSYYAYKHGPIQFVVLNSYANTTRGSAQYNWLVQELSTNVDRQVTPWLVMVFHCPFHTTFHGHNNEKNPTMMMRDMEPLFVKAGVNLVVSGHNHAYVRTWPMIGNNVDRQGSIYVTVGAGGDSHSKRPIHTVPEPWVAHRDRTEYGYVELHIVNRTHARVTRILNNENDNDMNPLARDAAWIRNQAT